MGLLCSRFPDCSKYWTRSFYPSSCIPLTLQNGPLFIILMMFWLLTWKFKPIYFIELYFHKYKHTTKHPSRWQGAEIYPKTIHVRKLFHTMGGRILMEVKIWNSISSNPTLFIVFRSMLFFEFAIFIRSYECEAFLVENIKWHVLTYVW